MQNTTNLSAYAFEHGSWKYYNTIKKKAMEQEFSWSGLLVSLSIAFFVVLACAQALSMVYTAIERTKIEEKPIEQKIYQLESFKHLNIQVIENTKYLELINSKSMV